MCHTDKRNVQRVKQALPTIRCLWTVHIIVCRMSRTLVLPYTVFKDCMFWDVVFRRILSIGVHTHSPGTGRLYIHKCISRIFYSDSLFCFKAPESTIGKCSFCVNDSTLCDACIDAIYIYSQLKVSNATGQWVATRKIKKKHIEAVKSTIF